MTLLPQFASTVRYFQKQSVVCKGSGVCLKVFTRLPFKVHMDCEFQPRAVVKSISLHWLQ